MTPKLSGGIFALAVVAVTAVVGSGGLATAHHKPNHPNNAGYAKDQCKDGGWQAMGFRNQGQCVRFFASGGRNQR